MIMELVQIRLLRLMHTARQLLLLINFFCWHCTQEITWLCSTPWEITFCISNILWKSLLLSLLIRLTCFQSTCMYFMLCLPRLFPVFVYLYVCVVLPSCILYLWSGAVVHFYVCIRLCIVLYLLYFCVIFVKHLPSSRQGVVFVVASPFTRKRLQTAKKVFKTNLSFFLTKEKKRIRPLQNETCVFTCTGREGRERLLQRRCWYRGGRAEISWKMKVKTLIKIVW